MWAGSQNKKSSWSGLTKKFNSSTPFFLYKHNDYKHTEAEISLKTKHIASIF